jgi:benzoyl-CoA reductase/2-hydroxyglutaryl-CoA dehydratase subunit BcrC/BadD/HgdB
VSEGPAQDTAARPGAAADDALAVMTAHYRQTSRGALEWKASGGRVAGYFCDAVPRELIRAAGLFPYRLSGDGRGGRDRSRVLVDPYMQQPVPTPGFVWASLEQLLDGRLSFLDYLIVPNGRKSIYAIFRYLETIRHRGLPVSVPGLHYLDKSFTSSPEAAAFDRRCLIRLRDQLESWSGTSVTAERLTQVVTQANEQRVLLARLARARCDTDSRVNGTEALAIIGSSQFMDYGEHIGLLRAFLAGLGERLSRPPARRVFVGGSPVDRPRLYELIEQAGGNVIAEDHCWGSRVADGIVTEVGDPVDALAARYERASFCSLRVPMAQAVRACTTRARQARPDAAIFWVQSGDPARGWEAPDKIRELRDRGLPCLLLGGQDYELADPAPVREAIADFLRDPGRPTEAVAS